MKLDIYVANYGEENQDIAYLYHDIGMLCEGLEEYEKAFEYYNKSLTLKKTIFGEYHKEVQVEYNNLGLFLKNIKDYKKISQLNLSQNMHKQMYYPNL